MRIVKHSSPLVGDEEFKLVRKFLEKGILSTGQVVERFEQKLRKVVGTRFCVCTNSGSSSLFLILKFLPKMYPELRGKSEVILPSFSCSALTNAIFLAGLKPVFADINPDNFSLALDDVRKKITRKTMCVVFVHSFGICSDISDFLGLGVPIIEGIAQAFGGKVSKTIGVGSQGVASFTSFYATKVITTAEGGAVFTNVRELAELIKDAIDYDKKDYRKDDFRFNFKMSDISAAIGLAQLKKLRRFISWRKKIAGIYFREFSDLVSGDVGGFIRFLPPKKNNIFFRYVVVLNVSQKKRDMILRFMRKKGVMADTPIWRPLHFFYEGGDLPETERIYRSSVSLPIHPSMSEDDARHVSDVFRKALYTFLRC